MILTVYSNFFYRQALSTDFEEWPKVFIWTRYHLNQQQEEATLQVQQDTPKIIRILKDCPEAQNAQAMNQPERILRIDQNIQTVAQQP